MENTREQKKAAVEQMARVMMVNLIRVEPHIGRPSMEFQLPKELEIYRSSKKHKEFTDTSMKAAAFAMFPQEMREMVSIGNRLRTICTKYYLCDKYVNAVFLDEIREQEKQLTAEYMEQVDKICTGWDEEDRMFRENLWKWISSVRMPMKKRQQFYQAILNQIPTKTEFRTRCYMRVDYMPIPAPCSNIAEFNNDVNELLQNGWREQILTLGKEAVKNSIQSAYKTANSTLRTCLNGKEPAQTSRNAMANLATTLKVNNLFSNPLIRSMAELFDDIIKHDIRGTMLEDVLVDALLSIWQYKENGGDVDMKDCVLSDADFKAQDNMKKMLAASVN